MDSDELDFFLKGNTSLNEIEDSKPVSWITDSAFKDLHFLVHLNDSWKDLTTSLLENEQEWYKWFQLLNPEDIAAPEPYHELTKFKTLMLLKIFRPDRVVNCIKRFIIE